MSKIFIDFRYIHVANCYFLKKNLLTIVPDIDVLQVENSEGLTFVSLVIKGGITMIQSKSSGKFYVISKRTRIVSTFD